MPTFPASPSPSFPITEEFNKPQIRSEFGAGYVHSRPKFSKSRSIWKLVWRSLPEVDYQIIRAFFEANVGLLFDWVNPLDTVTYSVRFANDSLNSSAFVNKQRSLELTLEEE